MVWLTLLAAIFFEVLGTLALKLSSGMTKFTYTIITLTCYGIAFYLLSVTVQKVPLGVAYALWSGLGVVLVTILGWLFFKQSLDAAALLGMGLILAGVLVTNLFSQTGVH